ncbi:MAG: spore germination protein [Deltaproteobacteria bacterium]
MFKNKKNSNNVSENETDNEKKELTSQNLKLIIGESVDFNFEEVYINQNKNIKVNIIYAEGLADNKIINDDILKPLLYETRAMEIKSTKDVIKFLELGGLPASGRKILTDINEVIQEVIKGKTALVFDNENKSITFNTIKFEKRAISQPITENVVKGSMDSFVETLSVNIATLRRKIKTRNLIFEETIVGKQSLTSVAIVYIKGLTRETIIQKLKERLSRINVDNAISPGFVEGNIIDNTFSIFPQVMSTERPDKFCADILEGKAGLIVDGIPIAFIVPGTLNQFFQVPDDYSQNYIIASLTRLLRYVLMILSLTILGFFVTVTTFHQEMIPSELAYSIEAATEAVPFPTFIQVLFMLITFEALYEASIRLPKTIGQSISIVGAVIIGQAVVNAKLASPIVIVLVAVVGIAGFAMPVQDINNAFRVWRIIITIASSLLGLVGFSFSLLFLLYSLCKIEIFDVPYLSPYVGNDAKDMGDSLIRIPLKFLKNRPSIFSPKNKTRQE